MRGRTRTTGRALRVDWPLCIARGLCAELVPERVSLDEWGYPVVVPGELPADLLEHAQEAVAACPKLALRLVTVPPTPAPAPPAQAPAAR